MVVHGAAVVVVLEVVADVRAVVVWDGGRWATVHAVDDGRYGPAVERWEMHDPWTGLPRISCTPAALEELARFRLEETHGAAELVATLAAVTGAPDVAVA